MVIEEIQLYIDRLLPIVYDIFNKYDYNKSHSLGDTLSGIIPEASINNEQLYLFIYGHSQGGTSAFSAHYFFQTSKTKIVQNNFNLIHTVCSAGIYFSDILKDSTLLKPFFFIMLDTSSACWYPCSKINVPPFCNFNEAC